MSLSKEQANAALFSLPSIFAYSSPIFAPPQVLTQTVTQTQKKAGGYRRTQWIAHRAESMQKRRKALQHNAFRRSSYLHTQEVTGSSPAVSTKQHLISYEIRCCFRLPYRRRGIPSRCVHHAKRMHAGALRRRKRLACDMSVFSEEAAAFAMAFAFRFRQTYKTTIGKRRIFITHTRWPPPT